MTDLSQFYQFYNRLVEDSRKLDLTSHQRKVFIDAVLMLKLRDFEETEYYVIDDTVTITANLPYRRRGILIEAILNLYKLGLEEIKYSIKDDTVMITANLPYQQRDI